MGLAGKINRELTDIRDKLFYSFTSKNAYSEATGIKFEEINVDLHNIVSKTFFEGLLKNGIIKKQGDIYWFDEELYKKKEKTTNILAGIIVVITTIVAVAVIMIFELYKL